MEEKAYDTYPKENATGVNAWPAVCASAFE